jgi:hypothetical protein
MPRLAERVFQCTLLPDGNFCIPLDIRIHPDERHQMEPPCFRRLPSGTLCGDLAFAFISGLEPGWKSNHRRGVGALFPTRAAASVPRVVPWNNPDAAVAYHKAFLCLFLLGVQVVTMGILVERYWLRLNEVETVPEAIVADQSKDYFWTYKDAWVLRRD